MSRAPCSLPGVSRGGPEPQALETARKRSQGRAKPETGSVLKVLQLDARAADPGEEVVMVCPGDRPKSPIPKGGTHHDLGIPTLGGSAARHQSQCLQIGRDRL